MTFNKKQIDKIIKIQRTEAIIESMEETIKSCRKKEAYILKRKRLSEEYKNGAVFALNYMKDISYFVARAGKFLIENENKKGGVEK